MAGWIRQRGDPYARDSAAPPCLGLLRAARTARLDTPGIGGWLRTYPCSHGPIRGLRGCRASPPFEAEPTGLLQQPTLSFLAENPSIRGKAYFSIDSARAPNTLISGLATPRMHHERRPA